MTVKEMLNNSRYILMDWRQFRPVSQTGHCIFCGSLIVEGPPDYETIGEHKNYCKFIGALKILKALAGEE